MSLPDMNDPDRMRELARVSRPKTGVERIAAERLRQIEAEGWSPEHDDEHAKGDLALAGACYALGRCDLYQNVWQNLCANWHFLNVWPWSEDWWKPSEDPIRNLEKAGALIAAEIDRLQRLQNRDS